MKVLETFIIKNEHGAYDTLYKCEKCKGVKWFILTAGAYGTRDMAIKSISADKAAILLAEKN